jgi:hypothetical protein
MQCKIQDGPILSIRSQEMEFCVLGRRTCCELSDGVTVRVAAKLFLSLARGLANSRAVEAYKHEA